MTETPFHRLLAAYTRDPRAPIELPTNEEERRAVLDEAKVAIVGALDANNLETADRCVALAWAVAAQTEQSELVAWAHWCHGLRLLNYEAHEALTHLDSAREFYTRAGRAEEEGRVLIGYAYLLSLVGRLEEAEAAIARAMEQLVSLPTYRDWPMLYLNRSYLEGQLGRYREMLESAREAERRARDFGQPANQARALINQAIAAMFLGQFDQAETSLQRALDYAGDTAELGGRAGLNLARLSVARGDLFEALPLLRQARSDFEAAQIAIDQATVDIEEASLLERLKLLHEAQATAKRAADAFEEAGMPAESVEARLLAARLALLLESPGKAQLDLQKAQALADRVSPALQALLQGYAAHPLLQRTVQQRHAALVQADAATTTLRSLGAIGERCEIELMSAELADALRRPDVVQRFEQVMVSARKHGLPAVEQRACVGLARRLRPAAACRLLQRAVELIERERQRMPIEELKANLLSGNTGVYAQMIEAQLKSRQSQAAAQTLIAAKGGIWADFAARTDREVPDPAFMRAKTELDFWRDELYGADDPEYATICRAHIERAEAGLVDAARVQVRSGASQALPSLDEVRAHIPAGSVAVEYLAGAKEVFACVLSPTGAIDWIRLGKRTTIDALVGRVGLLLEELSQGHMGEQRAAAAGAQRPVIDVELARLYDLLLGPLEALLPRTGTLILAPHGALFAVPWAALRIDGEYLYERYQLVLVPSVAVGALAANADSAPSPIAPPLAIGYGGRPGQTQLWHVEDELSVVRRADPETRLRYPARLTDLQWEEAPRWLHIATHGRVNRRSPLLSHLEFADGTFLLADALRLLLDGTDVVTLSACETGTTPDRGGVVLALAGAFLCSGARAVLASLWQVDDQATRRLMEHLYAGLREGMPLPRALQRAQRLLIEDGYTHPYYWAAFQPLNRTISSPNVDNTIAL